MEPGANGFIDWGESLDSYFVGSMHIPLFFTTEDKLVGFALIKLKQTLKGLDGQSDTMINIIVEFYVIRPWRRKGIGTTAAHMILDRYPGQWVITTWPNDVRVRFWHHVVTQYKQGKVHEFSPGEHKGFPGQFVWVVEN